MSPCPPRAQLVLLLAEQCGAAEAGPGAGVAEALRTFFSTSRPGRLMIAGRFRIR
jgi:hypothetical protein